MRKFNLEQFKDILDHAFDEILIWDRDLRLLYINDKVCYRHYGLHSKDLIGKTLAELKDAEQLWTPSSLPYVLREKVSFIQQQKVFLGYTVETVSVPVLDNSGEVEYIVQTVREADEHLYKELAALPGKIECTDVSDFLYKSKAMKDVIEYANRIVDTKAPVMILGETGTGKSHLAKYIHKNSDRADKPFVCVNMASINPTLFESEFFGYTKGSFTGADKTGHKGFIEAANGGTLFLDEIGELPFDQQAKFLHVLQEEEFIPVGGITPQKIDIRFICATNQDLFKMVEAGKFRADLYHRLNVLEIEIPPLRERKEDIALFTAHFINIFNEKYGKNGTISDEAKDLIMKGYWRGNVRELSNVIERAVLTMKGNVITSNDLPHSLFTMHQNQKKQFILDDDMSFDDAVSEVEKMLIERAYKEEKSSRKVAAKLGISQTKANNLIRRYIRGTD